MIGRTVGPGFETDSHDTGAAPHHAGSATASRGSSRATLPWQLEPAPAVQP